GGGGGVGVGVGGASTVYSFLTEPTMGVIDFNSSILKMFLPPASYFLLWLTARMSRRNLGSRVLSVNCAGLVDFLAVCVVVCVEVAGAGAGELAELVPKSTKL